MNKYLIAGIVAFFVGVVALAGVIGAIVLLSDDDEKETTAETSQNDSNEEMNEVENTDSPSVSSNSSSISDLFSDEDDITCTWDYNDSNEITRGTLYISDGRLRQDYELETGEEGGVLFLNDFIYFWDKSSSEGIKYSASTLEGFEDEIDEAADTLNSYEDLYGNVDFTEEYDFDCGNWNVDESLLTPPSDIEFVDIQELFDALTNLDFSELEDLEF